MKYYVITDKDFNYYNLINDCMTSDHLSAEVFHDKFEAIRIVEKLESFWGTEFFIAERTIYDKVLNRAEWPWK